MYHVSLGLFYERFEEQGNSEAEYVSALRISPTLLDSEFFLDYQARWPEQAIKLVERTILNIEERAQKELSPLLKARLGKLYLHIGDLTGASKYLNEALVEMPSLSRSWFNLGCIYQLQYDESQMKKCYERAAFLGPGDAQAYIRLGDFYSRQNRLGESAEYYRRGVERRIEQSSDHTRQALRIYGASVVVSNDVIPDALLYYCSPTLDIPGICSRLSAHYERKGNKELAKHFGAIGKRFRKDVQ